MFLSTESVDNRKVLNMTALCAGWFYFLPKFPKLVPVSCHLLKVAIAVSKFFGI